MSQETVQTVERALTILRTFSRERPELSPSELARALDLPRTIVIRILNTLERAHFVERVPATSRYRIGPGAFEVGALYLANNPLAAVADEYLDELAAETGHTIYLGTLQSNETILLAVREGSRPVRFLWSIGDRLPVATTSLGKAILMHMTPGQRDALLGTGRLAGLTERSIKTRVELDRQLDEACRRGWSSSEDESYPGVSSVGAAILDAQGEPIAGLSLSFLNYPADPAAFERLGMVVRDAARKLTRHAATYSAYGQQATRYLQPRQDSDTGRANRGPGT